MMGVTLSMHTRDPGMGHLLQTVIAQLFLNNIPAILCHNSPARLRNESKPQTDE